MFPVPHTQKRFEKVVFVSGISFLFCWAEQDLGFLIHVKRLCKGEANDSWKRRLEERKTE